MERKLLYKAGVETTESLREKRRCTQSVLRKEKRDLILTGKRMRIDDEMHEYDISDKQVIEATKKLVSKSAEKQNILKLLRQAFSQGTHLIDQFLSIENSLYCLVGLLTGNDPGLQLDAAWCLTNISAGTDDHAATVIGCAGPYLITFLSCGNSSLQDQCSWAIGNLAGGSTSCRNMLRTQGVVAPLVNLIQHPDPSVVRSAAFALSNLARDEEGQKQLVAAGIIPKLSSVLVFASDRLDLIGEVCWILTYLSSSDNFTDDLLSSGILQKVKMLITEVCDTDKDCFKVLTPLLRCLGNIVCKISDEQQIRHDEKLFETIKKLLMSNHIHVQKESLWVISNIAVFEAACNIIISLGILPIIVSMLSSTFEIRKEAAYALCNTAVHGEGFCTEILGNDAMPGIMPLLKSKDPEACHLALSLLEIMLHFQPEQAAKEFEEHHGLECLEALEYSSNDSLRAQTNELLEKYFYKDDIDNQ